MRIAITIVISVVIILCGSVLWHGNEKDVGNKAQSYAKGLNLEPSGTGISDAAITVSENAEDYSVVGMVIL